MEHIDSCRVAAVNSLSLLVSLIGGSLYSKIRVSIPTGTMQHEVVPLFEKILLVTRSIPLKFEVKLDSIVTMLLTDEDISGNYDPRRRGSQHTGSSHY